MFELLSLELDYRNNYSKATLLGLLTAMVKAGHQVAIASIIQANLESSFGTLSVKDSAYVLDLSLIRFVAF